MSLNKIRWGMTVLCVVLLIAHQVWPKLNLDSASLILLILALVPWLAPVVKSIELPGGFKIEVQDVKSATNKVISVEDQPIKARLPKSPDSRSPDTASFFVTMRELADSDPNLALVGFRIEIERRLAALAARHDLVTHRKSANALLQMLRQRNVIPPTIASGLADLIALGNQAAHGAEVSSSAAKWMLDIGPNILRVLDEAIGDRE